MGLADLIQDTPVVGEENNLEVLGQVLQVPEQAAPAILVKMGRGIIKDEGEGLPGGEFLGEGSPQGEVEGVSCPMAQGFDGNLPRAVQAHRRIELCVERHPRVAAAGQMRERASGYR